MDVSGKEEQHIEKNKKFRSIGLKYKKLRGENDH